MAIVGCSGVGFVFAALLALAKSFSRPKNLLLMLVYVAAAAVSYGLLIGGSFVTDWIGDRTHQVGQNGILIGAIFPGIFGLAIIPQFLIVAWKQTSGVHVQ